MPVPSPPGGPYLSGRRADAFGRLQAALNDAWDHGRAVPCAAAPDQFADRTARRDAAQLCAGCPLAVRVACGRWGGVSGVPGTYNGRWYGVRDAHGDTP